VHVKKLLTHCLNDPKAPPTIIIAETNIMTDRALHELCFHRKLRFACCSQAEAYAQGKSEIVMGEAIKELGWKRSDVVLSTKIFW